MTPLLFSLLLPLAAGLLAFLTRRVRLIGGLLAVACGVVGLLLTTGLPAAQTASLPLDLSVEMSAVSRLFLLAVWFILALFGLLELAQPGRSFVLPAVLGATGLAGAALVVQPLSLAVLALQLAALLMVFPALQGPARRPWGSLGYLSTTILAGAGAQLGLWLAEFYVLNPEPDTARTVAMLFAVVAALTLALAPLHSWLPRLADAAPYQVTAWAGMVGQLAVIAVFLRLLAAYDWLLTVTPLIYVFILGGLLSMTLAGGLALAASTPRYWFAYAMVYSVGLAAVGLGLFTLQGVEGAALAFLSRIVAIIVAAAGFRAVPQLSIAWDDLRSLASHRLPAAIALACAGSIFAGIPPFAGFPATWLVYRAAYTAAPQLALLMAPGTALLGLSVVRLLTTLFQPPLDAEASPPPRRQPPPPPLSRRLTLYIVLLVALAVGLGLFPQTALTPISAALATLRVLP
ncbi:MAG: hypothetical protein KIT87_11180 [Anaerolineae bacterium]|nr:hypothetical protein [Anaerolineae bacterium]